MHTHTHRRRISPTRETLSHPARKRQRTRTCARACRDRFVHAYTHTHTHTYTYTLTLTLTHERTRIYNNIHTSVREPALRHERTNSARAPVTHFVYMHTQRLVETGSSVIHQSVRPKRHGPITVSNTCKHLYLHGDTKLDVYTIFYDPQLSSHRYTTIPIHILLLYRYCVVGLCISSAQSRPISHFQKH